jgi:hypothetical protein
MTRRRIHFLLNPAAWCIKSASVIACVFATSGVAHAVNITVGDAEVIYTKSQRSKGGGSVWPDGSLGVVANGDGTYDVYGANASKSVLTTGTLDDPADEKKKVKITNVPKRMYDYLAGGPVFEDPYSGARLMVYHAEVHQKSKKDFYSVLGLAISTDPEHREFRDLGQIIRPNKESGLAEVGGGSFAIVDGHFNVYYRDYFPDGTTAELAVARAPMSELLSNALNGRGTAFTKYYNGAWSEPGIGGKSSYIEPVNWSNNWSSVSYNEHLNQVVMISSQWYADSGDLYMATSSDGVNFTPRVPIAVDPGEQYYPSQVGTGANPIFTGQSFYVYYTDSKKGVWGRWKDAQLRRREITFNEPAAPDNGEDPLGYTAEWINVADYQDDFQPGSPADGWTYAWNSKGKKGKSKYYVPLTWSDEAQAYNTTGFATPVPDPKKHKDDYLSLNNFGGHPGQPKYLPIIGYTIQQEDGLGFYRIADSSIQKGNDTLLHKEDGLGVLVYVNDTYIGAGQGVLTDGLLSGFDMMLGTLNVGDTVWVAIDPLRNHTDDAFMNFDFSLQKLLYSQIVPFAAQAMAFGTESTQSLGVPEPTTAVLLLIGIACFRPRKRFQIVGNT